MGVYFTSCREHLGTMLGFQGPSPRQLPSGAREGDSPQLSFGGCLSTGLVQKEALTSYCICGRLEIQSEGGL